MGKKEQFTDLDLALLQAYLHEMFQHQTTCRKNFEYTQWYLEEKYSERIKEQVLAKLKKDRVNCDCEIVEKIEQSNWEEIKI